MNKIIAGNWKMNLSSAEASGLATRIVKSKNNGSKIIIIPSFIYLPQISDIIKNSSVQLGAQDCSDAEKGAYTGDVSAYMIKNIGCEYVIVGHSERRKNHFENDALINRKAKTAISNGLIPIICIGENDNERMSGNHKEVVQKQIKIALNDLDLSKIIIAYEPVWAIGTGKTATSHEIAEMHSFIKSLTNKNTPLLYGGSVNEKNHEEILSVENVDGLLIGGASIDFEKFGKIIG